MGLLASQTYTAQYRGRVSIDPTFSSRGQLTQLFYVNQILLFSLDSGMDITIKIVWRLGLCPRPQLGAHITPGTSFILKGCRLQHAGHASWPEGRWRKGFDPNLQTPSAI